jgi:hypothetical protein
MLVVTPTKPLAPVSQPTASLTRKGTAVLALNRLVRAVAEPDPDDRDDVLDLLTVETRRRLPTA